MIAHPLNRSVAGVEVRYLIFGGSVLAGCFALIASKAANWEQVGPLVTLVVGHYFGRRTNGARDGDGGSSQ